MTVYTWLDSLRTLVFPNLCACCNRWLTSGEHEICIYCDTEFPRTFWKPDQQNPAARTFYGRVPLGFGCSWLHFYPGGKSREILHQIKYRGNRRLAVTMGQRFAREMKEIGFNAPVDFLVPVPLHPRKLKERGYNQSALFAEGVAKVWQVPVKTPLAREVYTSSQTRKSRGDRWENVAGIFGVAVVDEVKGRRIVLVDDVITTGATAEACMNALLKAGALEVSVISLAFASE